MEKKLLSGFTFHQELSRAEYLKVEDISEPKDNKKNYITKNTLWTDNFRKFVINNVRTKVLTTELMKLSGTKVWFIVLAFILLTTVNSISSRKTKNMHEIIATWSQAHNNQLINLNHNCLYITHFYVVIRWP